MTAVTSIAPTEAASLLAGFPGSFGPGPVIPQSDFSTKTTADMAPGVASPAGKPFKVHRKKFWRLRPAKHDDEEDSYTKPFCKKYGLDAKFCHIQPHHKNNTASDDASPILPRESFRPLRPALLIPPLSDSNMSWDAVFGIQGGSTEQDQASKGELSSALNTTSTNPWEGYERILVIHLAVYSWLHKTWYDLYSPDRHQDLVDWYYAFKGQLEVALEKSDKSPEEQEEIRDEVFGHFLDMAHIMDLVTTKLEGEEEEVAVFNTLVDKVGVLSVLLAGIEDQ